MFRTLYNRLLTWARRQTWKRRARQRVAELERRLLALDQDIIDMGHFPTAVQWRLGEQRKRLVAQIENVKGCA